MDKMEEQIQIKIEDRIYKVTKGLHETLSQNTIKKKKT